MRSVSTFRFLLYLSLVDLLVVLFCTTDALVTMGFGLQLRLWSPLVCRLHTFITYYLAQLASLILTCVSVERALVITRFDTNARINTTGNQVIKSNRIEKFIALIALVLAFINAHLLVYSKLVDSLDFNRFNWNGTAQFHSLLSGMFNI